VQCSTVSDVPSTSGYPLDDVTRMEMEERLGTDLSDVRLHTDTAAQRSPAEIGARAYTSGHHIVIGNRGGDKHPLAHELTHSIQQRRGPVAGTDNGSGLKVSDPSDRIERAAEANERRVMADAGPTLRANASSTGHAAGTSVQRMEATDQQPSTEQIVAHFRDYLNDNKEVMDHKYEGVFEGAFVDYLDGRYLDGVEPGGEIWKAAK